jgi:uncharacterized protein
MQPERLQDVPLFPLGTVLFPDGQLSLKVFEQRYVDMTKICLRDQQPFGVCLIREGREVGEAAVPEPVGCLATIVHWDMPQLGLFHLLAQGGQRFRIRETRVAPNQLISATISLIPPDSGTEAVDAACRSVLETVIREAGAERFPSPIRLDDAAWVGYRLAEILPLEGNIKQALLELTDAAERLARLKSILVERGIAK